MNLSKHSDHIDLANAFCVHILLNANTGICRCGHMIRNANICPVIRNSKAMQPTSLGKHWWAASVTWKASFAAKMLFKVLHKFQSWHRKIVEKRAHSLDKCSVSFSWTNVRLPAWNDVSIRTREFRSVISDRPFLSLFVTLTEEKPGY